MEMKDWENVLKRTGETLSREQSGIDTSRWDGPCLFNTISQDDESMT
jgi:hypothetical protein